MQRHYAAFACLLIATPVSFAESGTHSSRAMEEIVVSATPFDDAIEESLLPVSVMSGEALSRNVANSLGATLDSLPGVQSASFGPGVGQPVIRGQSGKRVQVLQDGVNISDASNVSPDHMIGVEPLLADRIEVLRGPSTLLYGNGAIGGVVNVIDRRIPETTTSEHLLQAQQTYDSVSNERKTVLRLDTATGNLAFHFDAVNRDNDNVEIPGFAVDVAALEALEALAGHEDEHAEDDTDIDNTFGFIDNSNGDGESFHGGVSWIGSRGFVGFSAGRVTSNYGLPPGVHDHGHDEDGQGEEAEEHVEDEDVRIRLDVDQRRYDVKGMLTLDDGPIERIRTNLGYSDYEHSEIEIEGGEAFVGTTYANKGIEGRIKLDHVPFGNVDGVWGVQFGNTEFSALGAEAFIPVADIDSVAVFAVERMKTGAIDWEFGARYERQKINPEGACTSSESATSLSASALYDIGTQSNILFALSRSERTPTVEELYSNITAAGCARPADDEALVLHAATGLLEVGNPALDGEVSNNAEIGFRKFDGPLRTHLSAYYNHIDDYIYLADTGEFEGQTISAYTSEDARFVGLEGELEYPVIDSRVGRLDLSVKGDLVRADFDSGGNVPRVPAARLGAGADFVRDRWSVGVDATRVFEQDRSGDDELPTDGYTLVSLYADYHWQLGNRGEITLFASGDNLLDKEVRNHVSRLKHFAPEPGRNVRVGVRVTY